VSRDDGGVPRRRKVPAVTRSKHDLPGWFPFALTASGLIALAAGMKSNWGRAKAPAPLPSSTPQQAGVLHGPLSRWFFWYTLPQGATEYGARGPMYLTDQEAFQLEFATKAASLGTLLYRFVWIPAQGIWIYDTRTDPALLASREIQDAQGNVVGTPPQEWPGVS
jgi:hypothetical protein